MKKKLLSTMALTAAMALTLSACGGGSADTDKKADDKPVKTDAVITVNNTEPQHPLIPGNTNEVAGGLVIDHIYAGLQSYDEKGETQLEMAESIKSDDNQTWTIKIKPDQKFSDGSAVNAKSFVDAWNQTVKQNMVSASFFESVEGYDDAVKDAEAQVKGSGVGTVDMSGLNVVDDQTFTVKLKRPESDFPLRLGYSAYFPMPEAGIGSPDKVAKFGDAPISNGPYVVKKGAWEHNVQITLTPNPNYKGPRKVMNGGITMKIYSGQDAAYNDLLGETLDILDAIPDSAFGTFQNELGKRAVNKASAVFQSFTIPANDKRFQGEEGKLRRQALSYAINRKEICDKVFQGTRSPATDFIAPVVPGHNDNLKGKEVVKFDPEKAKKLWKKADEKSPWSGSFELAYNPDGGHQAWVDATMNSIKNTLGIDAKGKPYADWKSLRDDVQSRKITAAFRTGWQADYPSPYNFLQPLYGTKASSNDGDYSNPKFDELLDKALNTSDQAEANKIYDQAQEILFEDLPAIPLWYSNVVGGFGKGVKGVVFDWHSKPLLYQVTK
ncbi:peptide ABC transporter substrate-binding protein [Mobiluncus mulieris]|uniref:ABC transporter substrate-binding protein n=1 Tax=Mobiluncus mulieris TaxID=2052 RepID=A0A7Y0YI05_9ACTO|nr:ABC transporter substrate-binding protein [Mobiluncus mulieris]MCU9968353.1 ABC transporter substrate-binding protein [Mobiluncus mulieris]MCU9972585.1 ABC transporter substrate-binding protein [Mobiluncus mulieris]MCV0009397.1 ABC transporter substrate-binding protein [Mobiluncus mulieris]NMW75272.1 ABC transporter substrate-binding protein [Mobiluncus mulieris]NMX00438.1 ABC transporter substrate-binding protein [Mobiluncus mulieris]